MTRPPDPTEPAEPGGPAPERSWVDPALWRGLTQRRLSRRDLLRYAGAGAGTLGFASVLAACGVSGTAPQAQPSSSGSPEDELALWDTATKTGQLNFANWPYYIDNAVVNGKKTRPSIDLFVKETGIKVNYKPVIQANDQFFATIAPAIQAGQDTGWDLIVITNGTDLDKLVKLNGLTPLDPNQRPNFDQYASPSVKNPSYDPNNKYSMAWQSGFTGIGYNPKLTGREITSLNDLNDPKFEGKIGMFGDTGDLPTFGLLAVGANPEQSTPDDWNKAAEWLTAQRPLVRQYYDQSYITALQNGDVWLTMAWSGDIFQSILEGFDDLSFTVPDEGGALWTDNMLIPAKAQHPLDALIYMDFVYRPDVAAMIADWVNYITPVPGAKDVIINELDDPTVGNSPMVFPDEDTLSRGHRYRVFKDEQEEEAWNNIFQPIYQS